MKISVLGLGWFGGPLAKLLIENHHQVLGSTRTPSKIESFKNQNINSRLLEFPNSPSPDLLDADAIILNIPPFDEELDWFKKWEFKKDCWIIFISSTSVYPHPESKNAQLLEAQEKWVQNSFENWTILRFGGLMGNGRHPGKYLAGRKNLPGRKWPVNLIHLDDTLAFTKVVLDRQIKHEIIHVVSDEHPTREEFYTDYCKAQNLPLPDFSQADDTSGKVVPHDGVKRYYPTFTSLKKLR
jgi:nucleoside-diphosphate-sugar epimerase